MTIENVDIGLVSEDDAIVHFYRNVYELEVLESRVFPKVTIHRLACASGVLMERWQEHGGSLARAPTEIRPRVRIALLIDPDGNTVEAMQEQGPAHT